MIINLLTFIPWILYFIEIMYYRIGIIEDCKLDKDRYFKYINKNLFTSINLKEIFLFILFVIFAGYNKLLVLQLLFAATYIFLLIDFMNTLAPFCKKIGHKGIMVLTVVLVISIVVYYLITKNINVTYYMMFGVSILSVIIVYLFSMPFKKRNK